MRGSVLMLALLASILSAGELIQSVEFTPADLSFSQMDGYDIVQLGAYPSGIEVGAPRLPRVVLAVLIPAGAAPTSVEVLDEQNMIIKGKFNIPPAQPDVPLPMPNVQIKPKLVDANQEIYGRDQYYPDPRLKLNRAGTKAGYRIVHVELYPLQYNPVQRTLRLTHQLTFRLRYDENRVSNNVATEKQRQIAGDDVRSLVANPQDVERFAPRVFKTPGTSLVPPGDYDYVVISGATNLDSVFQRLADWKTKKGIPARVVQISWINTNYSGYDLAEKMRKFIIDANTNWGTIWVLLGGSADHKTSGQNIVPSRDAWYTASGVGYYTDEDTIPCDLYFSGLDGTWDFDGDHLYGEIGDSCDMYGDVYVGRASVYNVSQAQNFVSKVLTYEQSPPTAYLQKMLLPTAILWSSYEERPMQDSIAKMTPTPPWVDAKLYERNGTLSQARMIDSMNVGFGMGAWVGHGDENGIYMGSPYLTSSDADGLTNGTKQGIALSIACFTGAWDETPGGDCFSEHLVNRAGGGLIVSVMNSRYGWGAYVTGYVPGPSERLDTTYFYKIFTEDYYKCGQVLSVDKDEWVPYADMGAQYDMTRWCLYEFNLLGDPELPLWTATPQVLTASFPSVIQIGNQVVNVTVTSGGSPVNNALVCLQKGTETYGTGYTNSSGLAAVSIAPTSPGYMDITVTAKNCLPFQDTIIVQSSNYAYVSYLKCSVSDPGGNNNGQLNPGETAEIPLWVKNYGSQPGNGIQGRLRCTDGYVTISDTIKSFGTIPAGDSAYTGSDGYDVVIAAACPNGHVIPFTLVCDDAVDSTWTSAFNLTVLAPILTYQSVAVVGGNGNGILDPGETANLVVTLKNEGGAVANSVTSTLMESSPYITISDASGGFGTIVAGATADNSADPYTVTTSAATPTGTVVPFQVIVVSGVYCDTLSFSITVGRKHYYLWNPDPTPTPGSNMHTILAGLGYSGDYGTTLAPDLSLYQAVLVCVGVYSNNYVIGSTSTEATALVNYLETQDGRMYLEGGDVWYWDPMYGGYDFGPLFGISASADGSGNMAPVQGQTGTFTAGMNFTGYTGENNYMDHIDPTGTGFLIFRDTDNNYNCGVANVAARQHKTVGTSFELGLLTDGSGVSTRAALLDSIMHFFGCVVTGVAEQEGLTGIGNAFGLTLAPTVFKGGMSIHYSVPIGECGHIRIFDACGRLVRSYAVAATVGQPGTMIWNGHDDTGRAVSAGTYFVVLQAGNRSEVQKAILLR